MKKALSVLMAFVFLQVQLWAVGGPNYGALNSSISGTWSGVLTGSVGSNGLGLYELGMPTSGLGSGIFAFYVGGGAFFGTVVALGDGEKSTISGVFTGSLLEEIFVPTSSTNGTTTLTASTVEGAFMGGQFVAKITGATSGSTSISTGARMLGTASVTVATPGSVFVPTPQGVTPGDFTLIIDGFEQSPQVTGQVSLNQLTQTSQSGGGG